MICMPCAENADDWTIITSENLILPDDADRDAMIKKHISNCAPGCTCQHRILL